MKYLPLFYFFFYFNLIFSQSFKLETPTAAAFEKNIDMPVDLYHGTVDVKVPLYTVKTLNLEVPFYLQYNSNGLKASEMASNVGLGWSLYGGGMINRQIVGKLDNGSFESQLCTVHDEDNLDALDILSNSDHYTAALHIAQNTLDGAPDLYYYSFPGHSGKFIIFNNEIKLMPQEPIEIIKLSSTAWEIIDENGHHYFFEETETAVEPSISGGASNITSWLLTRITDASGNDAITFNYISTYYTNSTGISEVHITESTDGVLSNPCGESPYSNTTTTIQNTNLSGKQLTSVIYKGGTILFNTDFIRNDIWKDPSWDGESKINSITVQNEQNETVKTFIFDYSYFESDATITPINSFLNTRLKLNKITELEFAEDITNPAKDKKVWQFQYFTNFVPNIRTYDQDPWGYYGFTNHNYGPTMLSCGDIIEKQPIFEKQKNALLYKVIYPTGGHVQFEYEQNEIERTTPLRIANLSTTNCSYTNTAAGGVLEEQSYLCSTIHIDETQCIKIQFNVGFPSGTTILQMNHSNCKLKIFNTTGTGGDILGLTAIETYNYNETGTHYITLNPGDYTIQLLSGLGQTAVSYVAYIKTYSGNTIYNQPVGGLRIKKITFNDNISSNSIIKTYSYSNFNNENLSSGKLPNTKYENEIRLQHYCVVSTGSYSIAARGPDRIMKFISPGAFVNYGSTAVYTNIKEKYGEYTENGFIKYVYNFEPSLVMDGQSDNSWRRGKLLNKTTYNNVNLKVSEDSYTYETSPSNYKQVVGFKIRRTDDNTLASPTSYSSASPIHIMQTPIVYISEWQYPKSKTERVYSLDDQTKYTQIITEYDYNNALHKQLTKETVIRNSNDKTITEYVYASDLTTVNNLNWISTIPEFDFHPYYKNNKAAICILNAKHILTYPIQTKIHRQRPGEDNLVAGSVISFQLIDINSIHRDVKPNKTYALEIENPISYTSIPALSFDILGNYNIDPAFKVQTENISYSSEGLLQHEKLANGDQVSYQWGFAHLSKYPIQLSLIAQHSKIDDIAYSSFEGHATLSDNEGGWLFDAHYSNDSYNGMQSFELSSSHSINKTDIQATQTYTLSFWAKTASGTSSVVNINSYNITIGSTWQKYTVQINGTPTVAIAMGGGSPNVLIDELLLIPTQCLSQHHIYDKNYRLIGFSNPQDLTSTFEYDYFNRLIITRDHHKNIRLFNQYNYSK